MKTFLKVISVAFLILVSVSYADARRVKSQPVDTVSLPCRGVMETFSKIESDIQERFDFYKAEGITHYFYCPTDDKYCNRWGWKFLYNDSERLAIRQLEKKCNQSGLKFVWTVNPGERYNWKQEDYKYLLDKLVMMYYDGFRCFAVDFTDNPGDHNAVRDSLMRDFVQTRKQKVSLFILDDIPQVEYPSEGQTAVESLMQGYHFDTTFTAQAKNSGAVVCNLSAYDEFAKFAVIATADFSRNPYAYSSDQSLADAIKELDGEVRDAFMTFLRHTGQVNESDSVEVFTLKTWSKELSDTLYHEFDRIERVPLTIGANMESQVIEALRPWFVEFGRLGTRGKKVLKCMEYFKNGNIKDFWSMYITAVMSADELVDYQNYPVGENKLQPFCDDAMEELKVAFTYMLTRGAKITNLASTLYEKSNPALDSDFATCVSSGGHIEFAIPAEANTCHLLTGPIPEGKRLFFRQIRTDGSLAAEFIVDSPSMTFDIKTGAVKVDVLGDVDIYECIFVYL